MLNTLDIYLIKFVVAYYAAKIVFNFVYILIKFILLIYREHKIKQSVRRLKDIREDIENEVWGKDEK